MVKKRTRDDIDSQVRELLANYYNRRIANISKIKLVDTLKKKNPYLLSANGLNNFDTLINDIVNQYLQSSDSTIFGEVFFEPLAVYVSGGQKSVTEGVDIEIRTRNELKLISVKSGVNIFNANSKSKQNDHMKKAIKIFSKEKQHLRAIVGYCYGKKASRGKGSQYIFEEIAGKEFWYELSGDNELYEFIIHCIEKHAEGSLKMLRLKLEDEIKNLKSRWRKKASEIIDVDENGVIDWSRLVAVICGDTKAGSKLSKGLISAKEMEKIANERLEIASHIIDQLNNDQNLGRTKLAKIFYVSDALIENDLRTNYERKAAGPLDSKLFYGDKFSVEKLATQNNLLKIEKVNERVCYIPTKEFNLFKNNFSGDWLVNKKRIDEVIEIFRPLDTRQAEIVATLFSCWNDLLFEKDDIKDDEIFNEFYEEWNIKKKRFDREKVKKALEWMREKGLIPTGQKAITKEMKKRLDTQEQKLDKKDEEIPF